MKKTISTYSVLLILTIIFVLSPSNGFSQKKITSLGLTPLKKILIDGFINLTKFMRPGHTISPYFNLKLAGTQLEGMMVSVNGTRMRETMAGQYAGVNINGYSAVPGKFITFSIQSAKISRLLTSPSLQINGTVKIGSLVQITNPAPRSIIIKSTMGKTMGISWRGGIPPFNLMLIKVYSGGSTWQFHEKKNILSRTAAVKSSLFENNTRYRIGVSCKMGNSRMTRKTGTGILIDKNSKVPLFYYTYIDIFIGKITGIKK